MHVKLVPMSQKINDVASTNMDRCRLKQQTVVNSCEASVQQLDGRTNYAERISQNNQHSWNRHAFLDFVSFINYGFSLNPNGLEKTMLVRLLYVSTEIAKQPSNFAEMNLEKFRLHNKASEITGVLLSGNGVFLQVLEGDRSKINRLYANILKDQRHKDIELLHYEEIDQRVFFAWSMDYIPMSSFYEWRIQVRSATRFSD